MGFRDNEEALRARIEELEREIAAFKGQEQDRPIATLRAKVAKLEGLLARTIDERDRAIEDHRKLAAKHARGPFIPPGTFQRSGVFGVGLGLTLLAAWLFVTVIGAAARGCSAEPLHAGYIVTRRHHEAYTSYSEVCTGTGRSRHCHTESHYHPERWTVVVADGEREIEDEISNEEWLLTANGQWYCVTPPCLPAPAPTDYEELPR